MPAVVVRHSFAALAVAIVVIASGTTAQAAGHLLITEVAYDTVSPGEGTAASGEWIEIFNPTDGDIALNDGTASYFLSDDATKYYQVVNGNIASSANDFLVQFPSGATIPARSFVVVTADSDVFLAEFYGSSLANFLAQPGGPQLFELTSDGDSVPGMLQRGTGTMNLVNTGDGLVLFRWDGVSDLVQDVDFVLYAAATAGFGINKTGISIDGPDAGTVSSTYAMDAAGTAFAPDATPGLSIQRFNGLEPGEATSGGNGLLGHDESSETFSASFIVANPTPGRFLLRPDGDIADLITAARPLAISAVDGPGPLAGDYGGDGSLAELYGLVVDTNVDGLPDELWLGLRGQYFSTNTTINGSFIAIDVNPGAAVGTSRWIGPGDQLGDITGALDNDATYAGIQLASTLTSGGIAFDAFVGVTTDACPSTDVCGLRGLGTGGVVGSLGDFAFLGAAGDVAIANVATGTPAAPGTGFLAPEGIEARIPLSLLGSSLPTTLGLAAFTSADHTGDTSPNTLPENAAEVAGNQTLAAVAYLSLTPGECSTDPECGPCHVCILATCQIAPDGTLCDDTNLCTEDDQCATGICGGTLIDCSGFGDQCNVGLCDSASGTCTTEPGYEGDGCDDGDACTDNDICSAGTCGGSAKDCSGVANACQIGICDTDGTCIPTPGPDAVPCDDLDPCTENDACAAGTCAGSAVDCSSLDDACNVGVCNAVGACVLQPVSDSTPCDDGIHCTENEQCLSGVCQGSAVVCPDSGNSCSPSVCDLNDGECKIVSVADNTPCEDGSRCTTGEHCVTGECVGAVATDCSSLDAECMAGVCNEADGACTTAALSDVVCDDENLCTENDTCTDGLCGGTPLPAGTACGSACQAGVCDALTGQCNAVNLPDGTDCDDENACTEQTRCLEGVCTGNDLEDGTPCDDDNLCTSDDGCFEGSCRGSAIDCSAESDGCNLGTCDASSGACIKTPLADGSACDDEDPCTHRDQCNAGACAGQAVADGTTCNDGDPCTSGESCQAGVCSGGSPACNPPPDQADTVEGAELVDGPDATDDGGCGCRLATRHATGRGALPFALLLVGIGLVLRRGRRAA